jgi:hypothetical protein
MSLPASQQRALDQIEKALADDHPGLGPLFFIFTNLTGHEAMPMTERVKDRRWRRLRMRPAVAAVIGLAMATGALLSLSLTLPSPPACPGAVAHVAAYTRPVPTVRQVACAPRQVEPSTTNQSEPDAP